MKTALFIPCYDGHIRTFHLVIKEVEKRGMFTPLVVYIEQVHSTKMAEYMDENRLPYIRISLPAYSGSSAGGGITARIRNGWGYYRYLRSVQHYIGELFDEHQVAFVLTVTDGFRNDVFFLFEAYKRQIPSLCLYNSITSANLAQEISAMAQSSLPDRLFRRLLMLAGLPTRDAPVTSRGYADKVTIWGDRQYEAIMERGADPAKLVITGSPAHDLIYRKINEETSDKRIDLRRSLGISDVEKIILFTTQPVANDGLCDAAEQQKMTEKVVENCARYKDCSLIIKLHPRESISDYRYLEQHVSDNRVRLFSEEDADLYELVSLSDIMITWSSSTAVDAILFGKDIVIIDVLTDVKDAMGYVASGAALGINNLDELFDILNKLLNDKEIKLKLKQGRDRFIEGYIYRFDGMSTDRVTDLISEMAPEVS